jgi:arylsulfatase A-like enzyme
MSGRPPNIIFLMTDQHRWDALGCVTPLVKTPNLDRLAAEGVRFSEACCNVPMCVASRYSMMTGLYGFQTGFRHNTNQALTDEQLPLPVLPQRLLEAGYQTAGFGKTHWWDTQGVPPPVPSRRGFEVRAIARRRGGDEDEPGAVMWDDDDPASCDVYDREVAAWGRGQGTPEALQGQQSVLSPLHTREGWLTRQAMRFMEQGRDRGRPLFLYLSFDYPHAGFNMPAGDYESLYDIDTIPDRVIDAGLTHVNEHYRKDSRFDAWQAMTPRQRRLTTFRYYALCSYVDDLFGRVLDRLRAAGELDNALIVFLSDHGDKLGDRRHCFDKFSMYEGSVRVPMILGGSALPGALRSTVDPRPAELVDVLPTLMQVAGLDVPPCLPGRSLLDPPCREGQFCEMHGRGYESRQAAPTWMWRSGGWKLILHQPGWLADAAASDTMQGELYDLRADPLELQNLYNDPAHLATRERLLRQLIFHLSRQMARYPAMPGGPSIAPTLE